MVGPSSSTRGSTPPMTPAPSMRGSTPPVTPAPSMHGLSVFNMAAADSVMGDDIDSAFVDNQEQLKIDERAMKRLAVYEGHASGVAHDIADKDTKNRFVPFSARSIWVWPIIMTSRRASGIRD